jgi:hypothetical protein
MEYPLNDPVQEEFFTTDSVGGLSEALVREAIQNSIDARADKSVGTVRVRFDFGGRKGLSREESESYFCGLASHLRAEGNGLRDVPRMGASVPFVVIEDFGTTGLCGKVDEHDVDEGDGQCHDFYWFWRNVGRSGKSKEDLGRWGLGKAVFPALSQVNTFFGLSVSADDKAASLMGQCTLKIHRDGQDSDRCSPYGYNGVFDPGVGDGYFPFPIQDTAIIERFCRVHRLQRGATPGFSVVIPFPDAQLNARETLQAIVKQWFYPIVTGRLEVTVAGSDINATLNASTVDEIIGTMDPKVDAQSGSLLGLLRFAKAAIVVPDEAKVPLSPRSMGAPYWSEVSVDDTKKKQLQADFERGKMLAFRVTIRAQEQGAKTVTSFFDVYMERDDRLQRCEDYFVRAGITISSVHSRVSRGVRALVVIDDAPLRKLLGDAENPAHTEWQRDSRKFKGKYEYGASILDFVKSSVREVVSLLTPIPTELHRSLLDDVFYVDELPDEDEPPDDGKREPDGTGPPPPPPPPPEPKPYALVQTPSGFKVRANPGHGATPRLLRILTAYRVRRGNPFTRYNELDFDLANPPIEVQANQAEIRTRSRNELKLKITGDDFCVTVTGFDPLRDLRVSVTDVGGSE